MFNHFYPWLVAGVATRIGADHLARRKLSHRINIPQGLAATLVLISILAGLVRALPLPPGFIIGFLLLDAVLVKV